MTDEPTKRVEFLEDRLIFDIGMLRRVYGTPDRPSRTEVLYEHVPKLPEEPHFEDGSFQFYERLEPILVEKAGKTIVFYREKFVESSSQAAEEFIHGPYLVKEDPPYVTTPYGGCGDCVEKVSGVGGESCVDCPLKS
jgi:hypothetical protein